MSKSNYLKIVEVNVSEHRNVEITDYTSFAMHTFELKPAEARQLAIDLVTYAELAEKHNEHQQPLFAAG